MNYYEHHLGDYAEATAHLSFVEDAAYSKLLRKIYSTERALPAEKKSVYRLIAARTKDERTAVDAVLDEFFELRDDGWHNARADREIARFQDKQRKAKASADARWANRPDASDGNANASADAMRTHSEGNALQSPVTNPQSPVRRAKAPSSPAKLPTTPTKEIIELYHEVLPELPAVRLHTKDRVRAIGKLWCWVLTSCKADDTRRATTSEEALAWIRSYFERALENDFLMGRTVRTGEHANWKCDLDFLLTDKGMKQVIEKTQAAG